MLPHSQPLSIHQKMNFINTNVVSIVQSFWQVRCQIRLEVLRGSFALWKRKEPSHEFCSVSKIKLIIQNYHKHLSGRNVSKNKAHYSQIASQITCRSHFWPKKQWKEKWLFFELFENIVL